MKKMEPFDVYKQYVAIKTHFSSTYDYFKYHGKTRASWRQFEKAKGKAFYAKVGKLYGCHTPDFIARSFASTHNPNWIGDMLDEQYLDDWTDHVRFIEGLTYTFKRSMSDIGEILEQNELTLKQFLKAAPGELPGVEKARKKGLTNIETCVILHKLTSYATKVKSDNPLWDDAKKTIIKYEPWVKINDLKPYADILYKYV